MMEKSSNCNMYSICLPTRGDGGERRACFVSFTIAVDTPSKYIILDDWRRLTYREIIVINRIEVILNLLKVTIPPKSIFSQHLKIVFLYMHRWFDVLASLNKRPPAGSWPHGKLLKTDYNLVFWYRQYFELYNGLKR